MEFIVNTPDPGSTDKALAETLRQIDHARFSLSHADTKASLLAAGTIPVTALLLAAPSLTHPLGAVGAFVWASAGFMMIGIGFLGAVVWPRLGGNGGIRAAAHRSVEQVVDQTIRRVSEPEQHLRAATEELSVLATLAFDKFRKLQAAMANFAIAAVLMLATAIAFVVSG